MGASSSKYEEIPAKKNHVKGDPMSFYLTPETRKAMRSKPTWTPNETVDPMIDPTADKYDYLIVFKKSTQSKLVEVDPKTGHTGFKMLDQIRISDYLVGKGLMRRWMLTR